MPAEGHEPMVGGGRRPEAVGPGAGHSWGGHESSFILTQTDMFAAVVTGAPPTNLVSF